MPPSGAPDDPTTGPRSQPLSDSAARIRLRWEIVIVLALSIGQSAVYAVLSLIRSLQRTEPLSDQTAQLNPARDTQPLWDATYRVLEVAFDLALVALVIYLLWEPGRSALRRIGLDFSRFGGDVGRGLLLVAVIGVPGIGLYAAGRALGLTVTVEASPPDGPWWTIPLLLASAVRAGLLEETIVVGYLFDRLARLGWRPWVIVLSAAVLRGSYHAYQGVPAVLGNIAMGLVFGWCYLRWRRVMPLVAAHTVIDTAAFVGYPYIAPYLP